MLTQLLTLLLSLQLALSPAQAGYAFSGSKGANVSVTSSIGTSAFENNYLTHNQIDDLRTQYEDCKADPTCSDEAMQSILDHFDQLSFDQQQALEACETSACAVEKLSEWALSGEEVDWLNSVAGENEYLGALADANSQVAFRNSWYQASLNILTSSPRNAFSDDKELSEEARERLWEMASAASGVVGTMDAANNILSAISNGENPNLVDVIEVMIRGKKLPEVGGDDSAVFEDLAKFRDDLGLPPAGSAADKSTLAVVEVNGQKIYGINGHGQQVAGVNAISATHAEIDALNQIKQQGIDVRGQNLILHVDRTPCAACDQNGGIRSMVEQLGLNQLTVIGPEGPQIIRPRR